MNFKVSIITAVYNGEGFLESYFDTISKLPKDLFDLVIIDGGSSDKSNEIIKRHQHLIKYYKSEKDKGIYDAWNKGLKAAECQWIMFVGCDDNLLPSSLQDYADFIAADKTRSALDLICSKKMMVDENGQKIRILGSPFDWAAFKKEMTIAHPGALHNKNLFDRNGGFNTNFRIVGDYEFFLRVGSTLKSAFMNKVTIQMREGGASDSVAAIKEHYKAVVETKNLDKTRAGLNYIIVLTKFLTKKTLRKFKINAFLKPEFKTH